MIRVKLQSTPLFSQLGLGTTFKTVKIDDGMTIEEAGHSLVPKITRGLEPDVKKLVEDNCAKYAFFARHTALGTVSLIAPDDLAMDWIPTGIKGNAFSVEYGPQPQKSSLDIYEDLDDGFDDDSSDEEDSVKKREKLHVTLAETSLFCQLGIQGTVKTINITEETNMKEAKFILINRFTLGMDEDRKDKLMTDLQPYDFYARHSILQSVSKIDESEKANLWKENGIKGNGFIVEFSLAGSGPVSKRQRIGNKWRGREGTVSHGSKIQATKEKEKPALPSYFGNHLLHLIPKKDDKKGAGGGEEEVEGEDEWDLPPVFVETAKHIQKSGMCLEGIFRISASQGELDEAKAVCDLRAPLPFTETESPDSLYLSAALLKVFLRELSEPLCTWGFYDLNQMQQFDQFFETQQIGLWE